jgi:hypothetical protein
MAGIATSPLLLPLFLSLPLSLLLPLFLSLPLLLFLSSLLRVAVVCSFPAQPKEHVISTLSAVERAGALCRRSGETRAFRLCRCLYLCLSSRRDLLLSLPVYAVILERSERGIRLCRCLSSIIATHKSSFRLEAAHYAAAAEKNPLPTNTSSEPKAPIYSLPRSRVPRDSFAVTTQNNREYADVLNIATQEILQTQPTTNSSLERG